MWLDEVLEYDWACAPNGHKLKGGKSDGFDLHKMKTLLLPLTQTAHTCGMTWKHLLVFHQTVRLTERDIYSHAEAVKARILHDQSSRTPA